MGKERGDDRRGPDSPYRLGVLGGTFDPVHIGHLRLAIEAVERFELDEVRLVLSSLPPHKKAEFVSDWKKRWRMLELACSGTDKLIPSRVEIDRPGPSYTVDTLRDLRADMGNKDEVFLLVGMDAAREMKSWKSYRSIFGLARVIAASRTDDDPEDLPSEYRDSIELFDPPILEISSTRIRDRVRAGKNIGHLVPQVVQRYIRKEGLYLDEPLSDSTGTGCARKRRASP